MDLAFSLTELGEYRIGLLPISVPSSFPVATLDLSVQSHVVSGCLKCLIDRGISFLRGKTLLGRHAPLKFVKAEFLALQFSFSVLCYHFLNGLC